MKITQWLAGFFFRNTAQQGMSYRPIQRIPDERKPNLTAALIRKANKNKEKKSGDEIATENARKRMEEERAKSSSYTSQLEQA